METHENNYKFDYEKQMVDYSVLVFITQCSALNKWQIIYVQLLKGFTS